MEWQSQKQVLNALEARVKELEGALSHAIKALEVVNSLGASKPIIERLKKTLDKLR